MTTQKAVAYAAALICVSCGSGESREGMPERASARHLKSGRDNGASFRDFQRRAFPQLAGHTSLETCVPDCVGRQCGPDGCGGQCGCCAEDQYCDFAGVCNAGCNPDPIFCSDCCKVCPSAFYGCFGFGGYCYGCDTSSCSLTCEPYCS
jgi:hypothetical protein